MILIERAKIFAKEAHKLQKRKYNNHPYWVHLQGVATLVEMVDHTEEMSAAAWLHDTVEDTETTSDQIHDVFGPKVADLVYWLTDISVPGNGNRKARKTLDKDFIANAPDSAKTIKLADLIDNCLTIVPYDPGFAKVYLKEKADLLSVLIGGDPRLMFMAQSTLKLGLIATQKGLNGSTSITR